MQMQQQQKIEHPSLCSQGRALGMTETRDVRKYLREHKL
jgi:hypothetical protein